MKAWLGAGRHHMLKAPLLRVKKGLAQKDER